MNLKFLSTKFIFAFQINLFRLIIRSPFQIKIDPIQFISAFISNNLFEHPRMEMKWIIRKTALQS